MKNKAVEWIILLFLLGVVYNIFLPFVEVPDEHIHFGQSYAISNILLGVQNDFNNGIIIEQQGIKKLNKESEETDSYYLKFKKFWNDFTYGNEIDSEPDINYQYSPSVKFAYIIPALGITLSRLQGLSWQYIYLSGRLINLLFFCLVIYISVKLCPDLFYAIAGISLLPSVIWLAASYSYDGWNISLSILFISLCMKYRTDEADVSLLRILSIFVILFLFIPIKYVYAVMALAIFLIPKHKWNRKLILEMVVIFGVIIVALFIMRGSEIVSYITTDAMDTRGLSEDIEASESAYTLGYVVRNPIRTFFTIFKTLLENSEEWIIKGTIGEFYSSYVPHVIGYFTLIVFSTLMIKSIADNRYEKYRQCKRIMISIFISGVFLVLIAFLFVFSVITNGYIGKIAGVQGRYFIPLFICLPFIIHSDEFLKDFSDNHKNILLRLLEILNVIIVSFKIIGFVL